MSHAYGMVKFKDGLVLHFEYNGTIDICIPRLWDTVQEVNEHWRSNEPWGKPCNCHPESVEIYTDYGCGFHWEGHACRVHKLILDGLDPYEDDDCPLTGTPKWVNIERFTLNERNNESTDS